MRVEGPARDSGPTCAESRSPPAIVGALVAGAMIFVFVLGSIGREHVLDVAAAAGGFERSEPA